MTARRDRLILYILTLRDALHTRDKAKLKQLTFSQDPKVDCFNYWSFRITGETKYDDYVACEWALEFHDRGGSKTGFIYKVKLPDRDWITTTDIKYTNHFCKELRRYVRSMYETCLKLK